MKNIILLEPVFKNMVWGGNRMEEAYGYCLPSETTGECWAISAHEKGDCLIKNGEYQGKTLSWLWSNRRDLFGGAEGEVFPLLTKIIDAKQDLSIQVHPNDEYAKKYENGALGKKECWYILDCASDGQIVIGHNAKSKEELQNMIEAKQWSNLIRILPIKKGDFFQIDPGTVHAIKGGTMILETQQNSDITYRLYDYDRLEKGKPRELHIEKSLDVIACPHRDSTVQNTTITEVNYDRTVLVSCDKYTVEKLSVHGEQEFSQNHNFQNVSVLNGSGVIDEVSIKKGDHFIIPADYGNYRLSGNMELIISYI
ncbi:MAG: mannose-6-phosphate isomerase, class I [Mobilitalea sp.]